VGLVLSSDDSGHADGRLIPMLPFRSLRVILLSCAATAAFSQTGERGPDGFLLRAPNLPKPLDLLQTGPRIASFPGRYINDHTVIYDPVRRQWHMFGIISGETSFLHLSADALTQPRWKEGVPYRDGTARIWAPHIIAHGGRYFMFYTRIGVPREIVVTESTDLVSWSQPRLVLASAGADGIDLKNKDPMLLRDGDRWILYVSMLKDASHWVVGYSVSRDLRTWSPPQPCFDENTTMPGVESPFVVRRGGSYYLFLSARPWPYGYVEVFRSASPFGWRLTDKVKWLDWHAPEIVRDFDERWYITLCGYERERDGFSIAPLAWNDYLDAEPSSVEIPGQEL
jgi:hypothetical protein